MVLGQYQGPLGKLKTTTFTHVLAAAADLAGLGVLRALAICIC